jgi:hypothetical protein
MRRALLLGILAVAAAGAARAQAIALVYGPEETVYGSCRPALTLTNTGEQPIDYAQLDMRYRLRDGRTIVAEQKSRYRDGVANPIVPAGKRALVIHHDEATPFGAPCSDIVAATIIAVTCRTVSGQDCAPTLGLKPGADLPLTR